jgi:hypothetical protein
MPKACVEAAWDVPAVRAATARTDDMMSLMFCTGTFGLPPWRELRLMVAATRLR